MCASTSCFALPTISSILAGWMRPSVTSLVSARRAISRRTGSQPERVTAARVAATDFAPLPPDHPALHLLVRDVHHRDGRFGDLVAGVALDRRGDDPPGP